MQTKLTPWYLRLLGYKKYRRKELVRALIIFDAEKWIYYNEIPEDIPSVRAWIKK